MSLRQKLAGFAAAAALVTGIPAHADPIDTNTDTCLKPLINDKSYGGYRPGYAVQHLSDGSGKCVNLGPFPPSPPSMVGPAYGGPEHHRRHGASPCRWGPECH